MKRYPEGVDVVVRLFITDDDQGLNGVMKIATKTAFEVNPDVKLNDLLKVFGRKDLGAGNFRLMTDEEMKQYKEDNPEDC